MCCLVIWMPGKETSRTLFNTTILCRPITLQQSFSFLDWMPHLNSDWVQNITSTTEQCGWHQKSHRKWTCPSQMQENDLHVEGAMHQNNTFCCLKPTGSMFEHHVAEIITKKTTVFIVFSHTTSVVTWRAKQRPIQRLTLDSLIQTPQKLLNLIWITNSRKT